MLYHRVGVVRARCQHNDHPAFADGFLQHRCGSSLQFGDVLFLSLKGFRHGSLHYRFLYPQGAEIVAAACRQQLAVVEVGHWRVEWDAMLVLGVDRGAYHVGIAADNGAVERVARSVVLFVLENHPGVEYAVHLFLYQVHDMTMHEFGGKAYIVGNDGAYAFLVEAVAGTFRQYHLDAAFCQQCAPEGEVLPDAETTWYANPQACAVVGFRRPSPQHAVLLDEHVDASVAFLSTRAVDAFALVARVESLAVGETECLHGAVVFAARAYLNARFVAVSSC